MNRVCVQTDRNALGQKALSIYKNFSKGSPEMSDTSHLLKVRDGYIDLGLDWKIYKLSLGAVPHHHLALCVKELIYSSNSLSSLSFFPLTSSWVSIWSAEPTTLTNYKYCNSTMSSVLYTLLFSRNLQSLGFKFYPYWMIHKSVSLQPWSIYLLNF